jgi:peptidoglycan/xylan/chitin deacetylase (PgdA/CDA1 family)
MTHVLSLLFHDVYARDPSESGFSGPAALRYKLTVQEFDAQLAGLARIRDDRPILLPQLPAGDGRMPFTITVDDGGVSFYTTIAERLEERGWRGHCLITTSCIGQRAFLNILQIRELHRRGHIIGTHSVSHPSRFSACGWDDMVSEWLESRKALADILGDDVIVASVPGGYFSRRVADAAREAGLSVLFTSEPETRVRMVKGCRVMGRFTIRYGCHADFAARLARLDRSVHLREWFTWNTKKVLKAFLGRAYVRLTARVPFCRRFRR